MSIPEFNPLCYELTEFDDRPCKSGHKAYSVTWQNGNGHFSAIAVFMPGGEIRTSGIYARKDRKYDEPLAYLPDDLCLDLVTAAMAETSLTDD